MRTSRRRALAYGGLVYLGLALLAFWHVWTSSPAGSLTCPCADPSLSVWLFQWPLTALTHGYNPFFSHAMFYPQGTNLLANTGITGITIPFIPITALFGPVVAFNLAVLLAPVLSGLSMMWLAQRWVNYAPAAALAGLLYGFSPLFLFHGAVGHLYLIFVPIPPLVFAALHELWWVRNHSPRRVGVALAVLVIYQFFIGTEVLTMMAIATGVTVLIFGTYARWNNPIEFHRALRESLPGVAVAVGLCVIGLVWPTYFALRGAGHYNGPVLPGVTNPSASLRSFLFPVSGTDFWWSPVTRRTARPTLIGIPVALVVLWALLRGSKTQRGLAIVFGVLASMAVGSHYSFSLWHYVGHWGLLINVMNERASLLFFIPLGLLVASVTESLSRAPRGAWLAGLSTVAVVSPFATNAARVLPYGNVKVWHPEWYQRANFSTPAHQVILGFPFFTVSADMLSVQALHGTSYSVVGGTLPQWRTVDQGPAAQGYAVVKWLASSRVTDPAGGGDPTAHPLAADQRNFKMALEYWHVTQIVVPRAYGWTTSPVARPPAQIATWIAAATGCSATVVHDAWTFFPCRHP
jgi:hypothetical protein